MEQRTTFFSALVFLLLGILVHGHTVDISASLTDEPVSLLFLFRGMALQPTITNLFLAKVALFFMLWGSLNVFSRMGKPVGGFVVALLIAMHPLLSLNGGYFTVFIAISALFWWSIAFSNPQTLSMKLSIPAVVALLSGIFISPWLLLFLVILVALTRNNKTYSKTVRINTAIAVLFFCCFMILFGTVPILQQWSNTIVSQPGLFWLKSVIKFGPTINFLYSFGALVLTLFIIVIGVWFSPIVILLTLFCIIGILLFVGFDLGGVFSLWLLMSVLVALAFDSLWNSLLTKHQVWVANVLVIVLIICLFQIDPEGHIQQIVNTRKVHKTNFVFRGGEFVFHPQASTKKLLFATSGSVNEKGDWLAYGNYHYCLPGRYRASFYVCQRGAPNSFIDVSNDYGGVILKSRSIPEPDISTGCDQSLSVVEVEYTVTSRLSTPVEHRLFYDNQGVVYFDRVALEVVDGVLF